MNLNEALEILAEEIDKFQHDEDVESIEITIDVAEEVQPGKRGEWLEQHFNVGIYCSVCGKSSEHFYKYCPNCGTKMDKEELK